MGLEEVLVYPTLWLYFLGSVNASREDTQIKANVLDVFLKTDRAKLIVRVIADVMSLVVVLWLTYWAWDYFGYAKRVWKESPTLYIPTFYAESAFFSWTPLSSQRRCLSASAYHRIHILYRHLIISAGWRRDISDGYPAADVKYLFHTLPPKGPRISLSRCSIRA